MPEKLQIGNLTTTLFEEVVLEIDNLTYGESGVYYYAYGLPPGIRMERQNSTMLLGTPTQQGVYTFTVGIDGNIDQFDVLRQSFVWTVEMPKIILPDPTLSIARQWNEILLDAIRHDFARPTVHARNLFHISSAMYDAWAIYDDTADNYLLNNDIGGKSCPLEEIPPIHHMSIDEIAEARREAISYAAYHLIAWRFQKSPGHVVTAERIDKLFTSLGYDEIELDDQIDQLMDGASIGQYIAQCYIDMGLEDGSNESNDYTSISYAPVNPPLTLRANNRNDALQKSIVDFNRWQPLSFDVFRDQGGNIRYDTVTEFVGAEWGKVIPFSLSEDDLTIYSREEALNINPNDEDKETIVDADYWVYHDAGEPPYFEDGNNEFFRWAFMLVPQWAAQLDPNDGETIDISPAAMGNNTTYPTTWDDYGAFYAEKGGDNSSGHQINPISGNAYEPNIVKRGDYGRVIAEFWADGPDSETPPGHWFTLLNEISDHPDFDKRYRHYGRELDDLEWDVKAYFILGGAMHDTAIAVWGNKGWYDYVRPVSVIRYMAKEGQRNDPTLPSYSPKGLPLIDGFSEIIEADDPLAEENSKNIGKVKLYTWRGHEYIRHVETDVAGVGWIVADNWWTYQRPTFVTPPFAGYVSGHSTFSRAAAEVLTSLTGSPYFPDGMGEFVAPKNEFLIFEDGPSEDVVLQWATYQDAADQSAISRIWGGIHPPIDDIPGRLMGITIGQDAFAFGDAFFNVPAPPLPTKTPLPEPTATPSSAPIATASTFSGQVAKNMQPLLSFTLLLAGMSVLTLSLIIGYKKHQNKQ